MWRRAAFMRQRGLSLLRKQTAPAMKSRNRTHSTAGAAAGDAQEIIRAFGTGLGRGEGGRDTNVGTTAGRPASATGRVRACREGAARPNCYFGQGNRLGRRRSDRFRG